MRQPIRAVAVVIKDEQILLMHRFNRGQEYYVFPGGGVEEGETVEQAVLREAQEEMSIEIKINRLLYHHHIIGDLNDSDQYFYLCDYISGEPQLSAGNELDEHRKGENLYHPLWYPVKELPETLLYPLEIRDWLLADLKNGFSQKVREATFKISELRQML